jgi:hypothetical protein
MTTDPADAILESPLPEPIVEPPLTPRPDEMDSPSPGVLDETDLGSGDLQDERS